MRRCPTAERTSVRVRAARGLAMLGDAAALAGCQTERPDGFGYPYPNDTRQRHPITIHEGTRTVELFIGDKRGVLTPSQSADVAAFAHSWLRESTGGIVVDIPVGTPNSRAAGDALG